MRAHFVTLDFVPSDLKADLELRLGHPVGDRMWELLVNDGHVSEVELGHAELDHLVTRVRDIRAASIERTPRAVPPRSTHARDAARSALATLQINNDPAVQSFRGSWLPNSLLEPEAVSGWLQQRYERMLPVDWPYQHPWTGQVPSGHGWPVGVPAGIRSKSTQPTPKWAWPAVKKLPVYLLLPDRVTWKRVELRCPPGGALPQLARVVEKRAENFFGIDPADLAHSILTGRRVSVPAIQWTGQVDFFTPAAGSYTLQVDPYVTPDQLKAAWADIRKWLFRSTPRQQSDKHLALAELRWSNPETGWEALRGEWNDQHPEEGMRYDNIRHFRRDVNQATRRWVGAVDYFRDADTIFNFDHLFGGDEEDVTE